MAKLQRIRPCLWFDTKAEEAARFYAGIFKNSSITATTPYSSTGIETHRKPPGSVMTVQFELDGQTFTALNGGPDFKFNEAISLEVHCESQEEIDYYWERLGEGGAPTAQSTNCAEHRRRKAPMAQCTDGAKHRRRRKPEA